MTELRLIVDHVERGLAARTGNLRCDPNAEAFMRPLLEEVQRLEDFWWSIGVDTTIMAAQGAQLDRLGRDVQQDRLGLTDEPYRRAIIAKGIAFTSEGHPDDLVDIVRIITGAPNNLITWTQKAVRTQHIQYCVPSPVDPILQQVLLELLDVASHGLVTTYVVECIVGATFGFENTPGALGFNQGVWAKLLVRA